MRALGHKLFHARWRWAVETVSKLGCKHRIVDAFCYVEYDFCLEFEVWNLGICICNRSNTESNADAMLRKCPNTLSTAITNCHLNTNPGGPIHL